MSASSTIRRSVALKRIAASFRLVSYRRIAKAGSGPGAIGAALLLLLAFLSPLQAEEAKPAGFTGELAIAGPLGDQWLGNADAPVVIIEYASLTCPHCADFNKTAFPELKKKYIDTGKVRYALREFPLDPLSTAAFMLSHCSGEGHFYAMIDLLFSKQRVWAVDDNPADALLNIVKQAGFTQDSFNACLKDQRIYGAINEVKKRGEKLGVDATPTFYINGKAFPGALSVKDLDEAIAPLLPTSPIPPK